MDCEQNKAMNIDGGDELFYVQNYAQGMVGNSMLWWKNDNCGYVCDVRKARKFTKAAIDGMASVANGEKKAWPVKMIDELIQHHVDFQYCRSGNYQPESK
jgi:hypothetical protein